MTTITFHQLVSTDPEQINHKICDLLFSFYNLKHHVYILCPDQEYMHELDEFIITYQATNFFPYQLLGEGPVPPASICLGTETLHKLKCDILINLSQAIPDNFKRYKKIIEFVPAEPELRDLARLHYKHYAKYNCPITTEQAQVIEEIQEIPDLTAVTAE